MAFQMSALLLTVSFSFRAYSGDDPEKAQAGDAEKADGEEDKSAAPAAGDANSDVKVDEDDVKLVVAQTGCTEDKAREALRAENGDLINASA